MDERQPIEGLGIRLGAAPMPKRGRRQAPMPIEHIITFGPDDVAIVEPAYEGRWSTVGIRAGVTADGRTITILLPRHAPDTADARIWRALIDAVAAGDMSRLRREMDACGAALGLSAPPAQEEAAQ